MKITPLRLLAVLTLSASFVCASVAQAPTQPSTTATQPPSKIGWIDTASFSDPKDGIVKYVTALKTVDDEFKPKVAELQAIQAKVNGIVEEVKKAQAANIPIDVPAKQAEVDRLEREFEFKKKDYEANATRRKSELLGPITADIVKTMQEYARQRSYAVIMDIGSLVQGNALLVLDPAADATKDFIAFYNSRTATATPAAPK